MNPNPDVVVRVMAERILPAYVEELEKKRDELAVKSKAEFREEIEGLMTKIFFELSNGFGVASIEDLGEEAGVKAMGYAVQELNGVLPPEFPYIIVLVYLREDESFNYSVVTRQYYVAVNEELTQNLTPLIIADNEAGLEQKCPMKVFRPGEEIEVSETE